MRPKRGGKGEREETTGARGRTAAGSLILLADFRAGTLERGVSRSRLALCGLNPRCSKRRGDRLVLVPRIVGFSRSRSRVSFIRGRSGTTEHWIRHGSADRTRGQINVQFPNLWIPPTFRLFRANETRIKPYDRVKACITRWSLQNSGGREKGKSDVKRAEKENSMVGHVLRDFPAAAETTAPLKNVIKSLKATVSVSVRFFTSSGRLSPHPRLVSFSLFRFVRNETRNFRVHR